MEQRLKIPHRALSVKAANFVETNRKDSSYGCSFGWAELQTRRTNQKFNRKLLEMRGIEQLDKLPM